MSKKDIVTEQNEEKKMTKYDQKMQKRKEAQAKAKKQQRIEKIVWAVVVVALVAFVASFPIRNYMAQNETIATINGEEIKRVEFDYHYNVTKTNYQNTYGSYMGSFGIDLSSNLDTQMYSNTLTFQDYFEKEAITGIITARALKAEAEAAGFVYDVSEELQDYKDGIQEQAEELGISAKDVIRQAYGSYATAGKIYDIISNSLYVSAYLSQIEEARTPSDADIQAYYEENNKNYDSVDFHIVTVEADLPTDSETEPTEEEIADAMAQAKIIADSEVETVASVGELVENVVYSEIFSLPYGEWLFDESRKEGDTTVVEDTANNAYHVVSFGKRYLDETPTADARAIINAEGQAILDEWKSGEATEESFAALADKYNDPAVLSAEGGLCQAISPTGSEADLAAWLFEENRAVGDTTVIMSADGNTYTMYYVGDNVPEWKLSIKQALLEDILSEYVAEISAGYEVEPVNGNLKYIEKEAAAEAEAESTEEAVSTEETAAE